MFLGEDDFEDVSSSSLLSEDDFAGRLFLIFNTSTTISQAQAIAIVLGITALLGGLAAAAYFFLLSMGNDDGGGYSDSSSYGHGHYAKRSTDEEEQPLKLLNIVGLIRDLDEMLGEENDENCKRLKICQIGQYPKNEEERKIHLVLKTGRILAEKNFTFINEDPNSIEMKRMKGFLKAQNINKCAQIFKASCPNLP